MRLFKKACLFSFALVTLSLFGFESNENFEKIAPESIVFEDGIPFVQDEWGALFYYPEVRFTHDGIYLARSREKNVIYICRNPSCQKTYYNRKPPRCSNCGGEEFLVSYQ